MPQAYKISSQMLIITSHVCLCLADYTQRGLPFSASMTANSPHMPAKANHPWKLSSLARIARYGTAILLLVMFIGTHMPASQMFHVPSNDKLLHFVAYFALCISALVSWEWTSGVLRAPHYFAVWLVCTLYGAMDEITQTPFGRTCDGVDWLADIVGVVAGLIVFQLLRPLLNRLPWISRVNSPA